MRTVHPKGTGTLSEQGKQLVALSMYSKGQGFLRAAALVQRHRGNDFVVLHLLCQGVEIWLMGLLTLRSYDLYKPRLQRNSVTIFS